MSEITGIRCPICVTDRASDTVSGVFLPCVCGVRPRIASNGKSDLRGSPVCTPGKCPGQEPTTSRSSRVPFGWCLADQLRSASQTSAMDERKLASVAPNPVLDLSTLWTDRRAAGSSIRTARVPVLQPCPSSEQEGPGELLVTGHADTPVDRDGLLHQGAGPVAVVRTVAVEEHLGVPPSGFGALADDG